jgi:hypothetical protein
VPWNVAVPGIDSDAGSPGAGSWGRLRDPGGARTEQEGVCPVGVAIHGIDSAYESPGIMGFGVGLAEPDRACTAQDGWMPWGVSQFLEPTWAPSRLTRDRGPVVRSPDTGSAHWAGGVCPVGVAIHGIDSDAESPGIMGLGVGLAEPGRACTAQDGWMPWGVTRPFQAPNGTQSLVAGGQGICCRSLDTREARQAGREVTLRCGGSRCRLGRGWASGDKGPGPTCSPGRNAHQGGGVGAGPAGGTVVESRRDAMSGLVC